MGIYALNIDFLCGLIQPRPRNIQRHLHTIWPKALCGRRMSQNGPEGGNIMIWTRIFHDSSTTLTFDLETLFKVTVHPLPKGTMWVKHDPDWAKGREDMLWTSDLGRHDHYMSPTEQGPNNGNISFTEARVWEIEIKTTHLEKN